MAKKRSSVDVGFIVMLAVLVFGVFSTVCIAFDAITVKLIGEVYKGTDIAFGLKKSALGLTVTVFEFNFFSTLAYFLPIIGVIVLLVMKYLKKAKLGAIIAVVIFAVAAILLFINPSLVKMANSDYKDVTIELAFGSILGAISSLLAAVGSAYLVVKK